MMRYIKIILFLLGLACTGSAATLQFEQRGWTEGGGPLFVSFSGFDADTDGSLVLDELTDFTATWRTPAGYATAWGLPNIEPDGFFFTDLGNYLLFVRNPDYSLVSSAFEGEALSSVFDSLLFPVDSSGAPATGIPEPGPIWLVAAGSVVFVAGRLRRHLRLRHAGDQGA